VHGGRPPPLSHYDKPNVGRFRVSGEETLRLGTSSGEAGDRRPEAGVSVHGKSGTPRQRTAEYRTRNRRMPRERGLERNSRHFAVLSSLFDIRRFISSPCQIRLNGYPPGDLSVLHAFTDRSFRQPSVRPIGRGGGAGGDCPTTGPTTEPSTTGRRVGQP
jgi:hypothetical protein